MVKSLPEAYGEDNWPSEEDYIDLTKMAATGPKVYHFVSPQDYVCSAKQAQELADTIPTFIKKYEYSCNSSHDWFVVRGTGQLKLLKEMVVALGGIRAITVGALATIATLLSLF